VNRSDDPNTSVLALIGVVGAILVFVLIVLLQGLFYRVERAETDRKTLGQAPEALTRVRAEQEENLGSYRWVNEKEGIVSIPIERAMELEVREMSGQEEGRLLEERRARP
jgi:hypothetical protein